MIRYGLLSANLALLVGVVGFVLQTPATGQSSIQNALMSADESATNPLDQLSSADIAVHVAMLANLDQVNSVANTADTVNAQLAIVPADDKVISKPLVIGSGDSMKSFRDIKKYTVKAGDTVSSVAERFGITSDSVRWSNGLSSNSLSAGTVLYIPPVNGIVYVVKAGDTPESLARRFNANRSAIIAFNDAEVGGLKAGQRIVIPDGVQPAAAIPALGSFSWSGYSPVYGGNGYDYGWCTWHAANRRIQIGKPLPNNLGNAITWASRARMAGMAVGNVPAAGAVLWHPPNLSATWLGHVAFVEKVFPDGSILVSDMNYQGGWGRVSNRTLSAAEARAYSYIY